MHLILINSLVILAVTLRQTAYALNTPSVAMKLPRRIQDISYKGTVFSYSSKNQPMRPFRDSLMESEATQQLEDSFTALLTDAIVDRFRSKMKNGIPSMAIPPLDPLRLDRIHLEPTIGGDPFNIQLSDVQIHGISDFQLRELKPKLNALKFRVALMVPKVTATCRYSANGTIYKVLDVSGEGTGELAYTDVLLRTQVNLALENGTLRVTTADPPLVDFHRATVKLRRIGAAVDGAQKGGADGGDEGQDLGVDPHVAHELGPLLFWMLADHVVEEIDYYAAKFVNNALVPFKVPDTFKPVVTWLMNRNSIASSRISSLPNILGQWFGAITGMKPQISISTKLIK